MKHCILFLVFLNCLNYYAYCQEDLQDAKVYLSNGKIIEGKLKQNKHTKTHIKIISGTKTVKIKKKKIDSLFVDTDKFIVEKNAFAAILLKEIEKGELSLYEINEKQLYLKRNNSEFLYVAPNSYAKALFLFCNSAYNSQHKLSKEEFIKAVKECNLLKNNDKVPFDSIKHVSNVLISKISFLRPEAGIELKLSKSISLFGSAGINFGGNSFREAKTYVNYDYGSELRIFYNLKKRLHKEKSNYNLSGPFIATIYRNFIEISRENRNVYGILIGLQENSMLNNSYSSWRFGAALDPNKRSLFIMAGINIGWNINIIRPGK